MRVLTATQMREADRRTIEGGGISSLTLMEHAGRQVAAAMATAFPDLASLRVAVVSGRGNNGGDGFVVARLLRERGMDVRAVLIGRASEVTGDAATNLVRLTDQSGGVRHAPDEAAWQQARADVVDADLIVDALVGTGLTSALTGLMAAVVRDINASGKRVVSIDLPSGLSADRSDVPGDAIRATLTVTLGAPKVPLVQSPAEALTGRLVVADIGIPPAVIEGLDGPRVDLLTSEAMAALVGLRRRDSHKGDYGHVLVVAGSEGKTGAAALTAMAALRSGAGLVTVATPAACAPVVAALGREFMTLALEDSEHSAVKQVLDFDADVIAVGPGLGRSVRAVAIVRALVERSTRPLVIDADALHTFAGDPGPFTARTGPPIVLTPHPGEMAALTGLSVGEVQSRRLDVARDYATRNRVVLVLKGAWTVIATPGGRAFINVTGNPGMATAGTGDVLTGAVAAWVAQIGDTGAACSLAVHLHGLAGDLAAAEHSEVGLVAGDVLDRLGRATLELTRAPRASHP